MAPPFDRKTSVCRNHPERKASRRCYQCISSICRACQISFDGHIFCSPRCRNLYWACERLQAAKNLLLRASLRWRRLERGMDRVGGGLPARLLTLILLLVLLYQAFLLSRATREVSRLQMPSAPVQAPGATLFRAPPELSLTQEKVGTVVSGTARGFAVAVLLVDGEETQTISIREGRFSFTLGLKEREGRSAQVQAFGDGVPALYSRALRLPPAEKGHRTARALPSAVPEAPLGKSAPAPVSEPVKAGGTPAAVATYAPVPAAAGPVGIPSAGGTPSSTPSEFARLHALPPPDLARAPEARHRLALTFDGGGSANAAEQFLAVLARKGVRGTFFLTGEFIRRYPDLTRRIVSDGHEVGNHTFGHHHLTSFEKNHRHDTLPEVTREFLQKELVENADLFRQVTGRDMVRLWRAPYGEHNEVLRRWAWETGWRHVSWTYDPKTRLSLDTLDWVSDRDSSLYLSSDQMLEKIFSFEERTGMGLDGGIVLLHLGNERRNDTFFPLGRLIEELERKGFRLGTVTSLLQEAPGSG